MPKGTHSRSSTVSTQPEAAKFVPKGTPSNFSTMSAQSEAAKFVREGTHSRSTTMSTQPVEHNPVTGEDAILMAQDIISNMDVSGFKPQMCLAMFAGVLLAAKNRVAVEDPIPTKVRAEKGSVHAAQSATSHTSFDAGHISTTSKHPAARTFDGLTSCDLAAATHRRNRNFRDLELNEEARSHKKIIDDNSSEFSSSVSGLSPPTTRTTGSISSRWAAMAASRPFTSTHVRGNSADSLTRAADFDPFSVDFAKLAGNNYARR